ncbi:histone acetyltransferase [Theileria orientalis]|uniref:Histone acetyltransferase n=1 Tax=Theileria orientalis TaxID=68886 RepID=A0A976M728_THEOR|nr:histone acetyltransferase [Theileria orientalis]
MEKFTVLFHPCENLDNYVNNTYTYRPLYTHHFFTNDDNNSAIQWVRYDVYYIVDTFELFIKVSGQLYMSKEESEIRRALYVVYKSIYTHIPEYTLILDESTFKHLLYMRSVGSNRFIPPGRIIVEIPLDNSSIFQLRYCLFDENSNSPTSSSSTPDYSKYHGKRLGVDDDEYLEFSDKSIYFRNPLDSINFDEDIYNECYMNISHKGNFDNCLIYDIVSHINKNPRDRPKHVRKATFDRLNFSNPENFAILHRRLEWFYHWFIEGASNIKTDSRWSIFIPMIIFTHNVDNDHSRTSNPISKMLTSNDDFKKSIANRLEDLKEESIRQMILEQHLGVISELVNLKNRRSPTSKLGNSNKSFSVTILGMVTAYYFFTINKDRLRISQFMIFPNYNGKGFGLWVLEFIYRFGIMDSGVREITVEDPTSTFMVLRYIVALKLCFESSLVDPHILYGNDRNSMRIFKIFSKESSIPSREYISSICKESKSHASKLVEILQLANILPNPISTDFFVSRLSNKRQKISNIDVKMSLFVQSDMYIDYCDKLKNKLKFDELKTTGNKSKPEKNSPSKYLNSVSLKRNIGFQLDSILDHMCNETISGYIRAINKLRKIFPKE